MPSNRDEPVTPDPCAYDTEDAGRRYERLAREGELFDTEKKVFDRYFRKPGRVLDIGCGAGRTTRALADRGFDVTGIDVSEEMVERGRALFDDLDIRIGDATSLQFEPETFEYVLFSWGGIDVIHPERNRIRTLREIHRVLEPGGVFAYSFHNALYILPALGVDPSHVWNLYVKNGNLARIGSNYKIDETEFGVQWYLSTPFRQRRQLRQVGFEGIDFVGKHDSTLKYFESQPYFVVKKGDQ